MSGDHKPTAAPIRPPEPVSDGPHWLAVFALFLTVLGLGLYIKSLLS